MNIERYIMLYTSNATGADLAPIDFQAMNDFETNHGLEVSDNPNPKEMKRRLALLLKPHQDQLCLEQ